MKTKITLLFTLITFLFSSQVKAQNVGDLGYAYENIVSKVGKSVKDFSPKNTTGNPYANKFFSFGKILFEGKQMEKNYLLRYNAHKDLIEVETEKGAYDNVLEDAKISCLVGNDLYQFTTFRNLKTDEEETGYIKIIFNDQNNDLTLFSKQEKMFFPEKLSVNPLIPSVNAKYSEVLEYFYMTSDYEATLIKKKKHFLAGVPKTLKKDLKKFIKREKISFKKEKDLARLFKYYTSIK